MRVLGQIVDKKPKGCLKCENLRCLRTDPLTYKIGCKLEYWAMTETNPALKYDSGCVDVILQYFDETKKRLLDAIESGYRKCRLVEQLERQKDNKWHYYKH